MEKREKGTVRSSTILIATREATEMYGSMEDVPRELRGQLEQAVHGDNSAVLLIADRTGRQRISDMLRQVAQPTAPAAPRAPAWRLAVELGLCGGAALLLWLLVTLR